MLRNIIIAIALLAAGYQLGTYTSASTEAHPSWKAIAYQCFDQFSTYAVQKGDVIRQQDGTFVSMPTERR